MEDLVLLIMRIMIGGFFIKHGYKKFLDPQDIANWLNKLNYRPGIFFAWMIIIAEFFGGILLILGLGSRIFAVLMGVVMIQGIYHRKFVKSLDFVDGWEINFVTLSSLVAFILLGSGKYSLDVFFGLPF
jgi:putative oxidoreductase